MAVHNPNNERIKRAYLHFLKEAKQQSEPTLDAVAKAIARFEAYTKARDFRTFHTQQAVAFKRHLAEQLSQATGEKLSKATLYSTLTHLKRFFQWLAGQPGFKSRLKYSDAEYFNLSEKESRIATARREKPIPTVEQIKHVVLSMPNKSDIERRNQALIAFVFLSGARDGAVASMKLKHVNLLTGSVFQDAREVKTKFSKTFTSFLFPVGQEFRDIFENWVNYLRKEKLWGTEDPLFPATNVVVGPGRKFESNGIKREGWRNASPIRKIFRDAFQAAGLPYFIPHSFRKTLVSLGLTKCKTPEEFKAWSQNLGHEGVLVTFTSYGAVDGQKQGEIIRNLAKSSQNLTPEIEEMMKTFLNQIQNCIGIPTPGK